jgi:hypothetical protein
LSDAGSGVYLDAYNLDLAAFCSDMVNAARACDVTAEDVEVVAVVEQIASHRQ